MEIGGCKSFTLQFYAIGTNIKSVAGGFIVFEGKKAPRFYCVPFSV